MITFKFYKGLKIFHLNIRSLMSKIDLLRAWASHHKPDIIIVTETWLHSAISNNNVEIQD